MALMDHHPLCVITAQFSGFLYNDYYAQLWRPDGRLRPFGPSPVIYVNWRLSNSPPLPPTLKHPIFLCLSSFSPPSPPPAPSNKFSFLGAFQFIDCIKRLKWSGRLTPDRHAVRYFVKSCVRYCPRLTCSLSIEMSSFHEGRNTFEKYIYMIKKKKKRRKRKKKKRGHKKMKLRKTGPNFGLEIKSKSEWYRNMWRRVRHSLCEFFSAFLSFFVETIPKKNERNLGWSWTSWWNNEHRISTRCHLDHTLLKPHI